MNNLPKSNQSKSKLPKNKHPKDNQSKNSSPQNAQSQINVRAAAAQVLFEVIEQGQSLSTALPRAQTAVRSRDHALLQEMCYGALRHLPKLEAIALKLMDKPLKGKQRLFHHLILIGLYQMSEMRIPMHAAVGETVAATKDLKAIRLKGLINAVLRNYQRNQAELDSHAIALPTGQYMHPSWLLKRLQQDHPQQWQQIIQANNQKAPMWLRVNRQHHTRDQYFELLKNEGIEASEHSLLSDAIKLSSAMDVFALPGFEQGWVSVQDAAAQLAVDYLSPQDGELILDCCAAPGGKTAHILERANCDVVAMDCDQTRLNRVTENLERLKLKAQVICGDARQPKQWWQSQEQFDKILLDAPCSATGVIRRHPDIKWLRRDSDIHQLATLQAEILDAMWTLLKPKGTLLYATCSILNQENEQQIKAFLERTKDAKVMPITANNEPSTQTKTLGRQIITGKEDMDGFYYCVLVKN